MTYSTLAKVLGNKDTFVTSHRTNPLLFLFGASNLRHCAGRVINVIMASTNKRPLETETSTDIDSPIEKEDTLNSCDESENDSAGESDELVGYNEVRCT